MDKSCLLLKEKISSKWQTYSIKFQVLKTTHVEIELSGPDKKNSRGVPYPVMVDFKNVKINQQDIFPNEQKTDHNHPLKYHANVSNGTIFELQADIRRHHFSSDEYQDILKFNVLMFCSIAILAFFFAYKLVQYIASFKLVKNYSRIEIFFLISFIALLLFPVSHILPQEKSFQENRRLAKAPLLFKNGNFNLRFTKDFEAWFNDRFRGRSDLLDLYGRINTFNQIIKTPKATYNKKTHWAFDEDQLKNTSLKEEQNQQILKAFEAFNQFLHAHNIRFYFLLVPTKADIYKTFSDLYDFDVWTEAESAVNTSTIGYLQKKASFPIIYPLEELKMAAQKDFVFFKTEHHWTEWGAYVGYQSLTKRIKADFPKLKIATEDDFNIFYSPKVRGEWDRKFTMGQTLNLLNLDLDEKKTLDVLFKYYTPKQEPLVEIDKDFGTKFFDNPKNKTHLRAILSGTSMNENFLQFLPQSFEKLRYYRTNWKQQGKEQYKLLKNLQKEILSFQPDIFILCLTATNLKKTVDIAKDK